MHQSMQLTSWHSSVAICYFEAINMIYIETNIECQDDCQLLLSSIANSKIIITTVDA